MNINWIDLPYHNEWQKKYDSIMNLGAKVTWPQLICEIIIENRIKYIKTFPRILKGEGWSQPISGQIRRLVQQCYSVCNYFPSPDQEPLVQVAFLNILKNRRICKIGSYRKVRVSKTGKCTISKDEKDFIFAVSYELKNLIEKRDTMIKSSVFVPDNKNTDEVKFKTENTNITIMAPKKRGMASLLDLESKLSKK